MNRKSILWIYTLMIALALIVIFAGSALAAGQASAKPYVRLDVKNAACLLVDHQTGLFNIVRDYEPIQFKNNVVALAAVAKYFKLPTVFGTSLEQGPNGPLLPELLEILDDATVIHRSGEINAWDSPQFVQAVKRTGRKQLIIAGIVTDVCVAHVALSAVAAGYEVFVVTDASGTFDESARYAAWSRMTANGVQLLNWFSVACELQRDWRNDMQGLANLFNKYIPAYADLITSHNSARQAAGK